MSKIILASGSPRRQELLRRMGIADFEVRVPDVDESFPAWLSPQRIVEHISRKKCDAVAAKSAPNEIIIAADTMVFVDGEPLGKPTDEADALRMLMRLQGRRHVVCTGVSVHALAQTLTESESTDVFFRPASPAELLQYIHTGEPMDKAGAYGVQGRGALLVEGIHGDFYNVMGLPILRLSRMLERFGVSFFN
jgi:septum formation protein